MFSATDLKKAYYQIPIAKEAIRILSFSILLDFKSHHAILYNLFSGLWIIYASCIFQESVRAAPNIHRVRAGNIAGVPRLQQRLSAPVGPIELYFHMRLLNYYWLCILNPASILVPLSEMSEFLSPKKKHVKIS